MAEAKNYIRIERDDDPERCLGKHTHLGQCGYKRMEGSEYCPLHARLGHHTLKKQEEYNYNLTKYRARIAQFADNPKVKSLREEIGVLRLLLETTLNMCDTNNKLLIYSGKLADLVSRVERVVNTCNTIETKTGQLLDKSVIMTLVDSILQILIAHISEGDVLDAIGADILQLLGDKYTAQG